jgi:hypothetical protein
VDGCRVSPDSTVASKTLSLMNNRTHFPIEAGKPERLGDKLLPSDSTSLSTAAEYRQPFFTIGCCETGRVMGWDITPSHDYSFCSKVRISNFFSHQTWNQCPCIPSVLTGIQWKLGCPFGSHNYSELITRASEWLTTAQRRHYTWQAAYWTYKQTNSSTCRGTDTRALREMAKWWVDAYTDGSARQHNTAQRFSARRAIGSTYS